MSDKIRVGLATYKRAEPECQGAVDTGIIQNGGVQIGGWVVRSDGVAVAMVAAIRDGEVWHRFSVDKPRPDIAKWLGEQGANCGFNSYVPITTNILEECGTLEYFAICADDTAVPLRIHPANYFLNLKLKSDLDFRRTVQDPATRIKDKQTLVYFAREFLKDHLSEFSYAAACLCVIGYRALESATPDHEDLTFCLDEGTRLLTEAVPTTSKQNYRWFISLSLMLGYMHALKGNKAAALSRFTDVAEQRHNLQILPQMLTNILKALYFQGRLLKDKGELEAAIAAFDQGTPTLQQGTPHWLFDNYYSYAELAQSSYIAQECFAASLVLKRELNNAKPDSAVAPTALESKFQHLGFPGAELCRKNAL
jgi:hypothetical protein